PPCALLQSVLTAALPEADTAPLPTNISRFGLPGLKPQPGRSIPLRLAPLSRMLRRAAQDNAFVLSRPPCPAKRPALVASARCLPLPAPVRPAPNPGRTLPPLAGTKIRGRERAQFPPRRTLGLPELPNGADAAWWRILTHW